MKAQALPDRKTKPFTSRDGTQLTPEQHRRLAMLLRSRAGELGYPAKDRAEAMAQNHEQLAQAIEGRSRLH